MSSIKIFTDNKKIIISNIDETYKVELYSLINTVDVVCPSTNIKVFKNEMIQDIILYIIHHIKSFCTDYEMANEFNFVINFYLKYDSPEASISWWGVDLLKNGLLYVNLADIWKWEEVQSNSPITKTVLGVDIPKSVRFSMRLLFRENFVL